MTNLTRIEIAVVKKSLWIRFESAGQLYSAELTSDQGRNLAVSLERGASRIDFLEDLDVAMDKINVMPVDQDAIHRLLHRVDQSRHAG